MTDAAGEGVVNSTTGVATRELAIDADVSAVSASANAHSEIGNGTTIGRNNTRTMAMDDKDDVASEDVGDDVVDEEADIRMGNASFASDNGRRNETGNATKSMPLNDAGFIDRSEVRARIKYTISRSFTLGCSVIRGCMSD